MAIVKKYKARVESIINPVDGIYTVTFSSDKKFLYNPGQFLHLALDDYDGIGQWPESRCFSIQNSPGEKFLKITFSVKGSFTKRMRDELFINKEIWLKLPYGDIFGRGHSKRNCVFIAGGTGITPFLSLFTDKGFINYHNPMLFFGMRSKQYNIYEKEIEKAKLVNPNLLIRIIYQDIEGILNLNSIFDYKYDDATYFISGPAEMIDLQMDFLIKKGVPIEKIIYDRWN